MQTHAIVVALLVLAVAASSVRMLWFAWRRTPRSRGWRIAALLVLQLASAFLFYRTLFPPAISTGTGTLVVATAGAPADLERTLVAGERLVALPEAATVTNAEPVPDLATALRRYPATAQLRIAGRGLTARDRDSARGLPFEFAPAPLPRGLIELPSLVQTQSGADFRITGRVNGIRNGSAELLDPAGQRVDRQALARDGRFTLTGAARGPGQVEFRVRIADANGELVEEAKAPVAVFAPARTRVLLLAGAPDAEVKYLRRWATDSGVRMTAQIELGGGMQLGDAPVALNAATLRNFDAAIVDERVWDRLGDSRRRALFDAVRDGMGLLLRVTGPVSASLRNSFAAHGMPISNNRLSPDFALPLAEDNEFASVRLGPGSADAPTASSVANLQPPRLTRQPLRLDSLQQVWLRDSQAQALAAWHPLGRGRIGVWLPMDTFQLVLVGRNDLHARLWSDAIAAITRPASTPPLRVPPIEARQGIRVSLCGLNEDASVSAGGGNPQPLLIDARTGAARCAGFWPRHAGWHRLHSGNAAAPFYIRGADELPGVAAREDRDATQQLALLPLRSAQAQFIAPEPRWPWFLAWLLVSATAWWFERSRIGRVFHA